MNLEKMIQNYKTDDELWRVFIFSISADSKEMVDVAGSITDSDIFSHELSG